MVIPTFSFLSGHLLIFINSLSTWASSLHGHRHLFFYIIQFRNTDTFSSPIIPLNSAPCRSLALVSEIVIDVKIAEPLSNSFCSIAVINTKSCFICPKITVQLELFSYVEAIPETTRLWLYLPKPELILFSCLGINEKHSI